MGRLIINELGPIEKCELECSQFMALTGPQASGKSTIAKAVYFFRTIKDDILNLVKTQAVSMPVVGGRGNTFHVVKSDSLEEELENFLNEKFFCTFGSSCEMSNEMFMEYHFTETCFVKISFMKERDSGSSNELWITFSNDLKNFLREKDHCFIATPLGPSEDEVIKFKAELYEFFQDECYVVYIPAGRSMMTLLSQQLGYIYATMGDVQKRSLDSCTKDYLEQILRLKTEFSSGLRGLLNYTSRKTRISKEIINRALELAEKILGGEYRYNNGEEQIVLDNGKYVKINFSSSGQQESVWILNLLFYYLIQPNQVLFIIEEPESHLFPESQKYMTELIALLSNCKHSIVLTTHSPYVLGTLNNLLYAKTFTEKNREKAEKIIPIAFWLDNLKFGSWFVKNGTVENCMDEEIHMIQNEKIDEISRVINQEFDKLLDLQDTEEKGIN